MAYDDRLTACIYEQMAYDDRGCWHLRTGDFLWQRLLTIEDRWLMRGCLYLRTGGL